MTKDSCGVYMIRNNTSLNIYTGSTLRSFKVRFGIHKSDLRNHNHKNRYLQYAWDKYGEDSFGFLILEDMPSATQEEIIKAEQWYFDNTKTHAHNGGGYNIALNAEHPQLGRFHTEETKEKIRKMRMGEANPFRGRTQGRNKIL